MNSPAPQSQQQQGFQTGTKMTIDGNSAAKLYWWQSKQLLPDVM
ncbi:hypothetical protein [Paenibacillus typhae]|nr:hypothetical protein [Paenibacillus typhae]